MLFFIPLLCIYSQNTSKYHDFSLKNSKKQAFLLGEKIKYKFSYGRINKKEIIRSKVETEKLKNASEESFKEYLQNYLIDKKNR